MNETTETIEASYRTAGGAVIDVIARTDFDGDYEIYIWSCPGCRAEQPLAACGRQETLDTAQKHAKACHALPRKTGR
ncbi:hypothetical protein [Kitasatospora sp. NPDC087314]|uniref:hypothetical protein n=1 Tax=Kitasatospora sp. NPDC087314 TaxID=3364068 RepID=UPI003824B79E